jgi:hypothetical protein
MIYYSIFLILFTITIYSIWYICYIYKNTCIIETFETDEEKRKRYGDRYDEVVLNRSKTFDEFLKTQYTFQDATNVPDSIKSRDRSNWLPEKEEYVRQSVDCVEGWDYPNIDDAPCITTTGTIIIPRECKSSSEETEPIIPACKKTRRWIINTNNKYGGTSCTAQPANQITEKNYAEKRCDIDAQVNIETNGIEQDCVLNNESDYIRTHIIPSLNSRKIGLSAKQIEDINNLIGILEIRAVELDNDKSYCDNINQTSVNAVGDGIHKYKWKATVLKISHNKGRSNDIDTGYKIYNGRKLGEKCTYNKCPKKQECKWSEYGECKQPFSACNSNGKKTGIKCKKVEEITPAQNGGRSCNPTKDTEVCDRSCDIDCPVNCRMGDWTNDATCATANLDCGTPCTPTQKRVMIQPVVNQHLGAQDCADKSTQQNLSTVYGQKCPSGTCTDYGGGNWGCKGVYGFPINKSFAIKLKNSDYCINWCGGGVTPGHYTKAVMKNQCNSADQVRFRIWPDGQLQIAYIEDSRPMGGSCFHSVTYLANTPQYSCVNENSRTMNRYVEDCDDEAVKYTYDTVNKTIKHNKSGKYLTASAAFDSYLGLADVGSEFELVNFQNDNYLSF